MTPAYGVQRFHDGASLGRRLERLRDSLDFRSESKVSAGELRKRNSPQDEARRVLEHCRRDLGLPAETRIEWHDFPDFWGEVLPERPTVIRLSRRLLISGNGRQLIETTAHECRHAQRIHAGLLTYDAIAERDALDYRPRRRGFLEMNMPTKDFAVDGKIQTTDPTEADLQAELAERRTVLAAVEAEFAALELELPTLVAEHGELLDELAAMQPALHQALAPP